MKLFTILFSFLAYLFCLSTMSFANTIFNDSFDSLNSETWNVSNNGGVVAIVNGVLEVSSPPSQYFPFITSSSVPFPSSNYFVEFKLKLSGPLNYGSGLVLTDKSMQYGTTSDLNANDAIFQVWPESSDTFTLWTTLCNYPSTTCTLSYKKIHSFPANTYQEFKIVSNEDRYEIYINSAKYDVEFQNTRNINNLWIGNPQRTGTSTIRPKIYIDYVRVESLENREPVIVIPGFGGSWDVDAVLTNSPGNNWKIPDFIKEYDGIVNSLKNAGYIENEDLFIFAYDWRKSLDFLADDLNTFITDKNLSDKNINLVGHSMGGLVARAYQQKYNNKAVSKIVSVGTPHKGILDAYGMWEGLTIWDAVWWQKALHLIATELNRYSGETELQAARRVAPSVKDLLPIWDFLQKDGQVIPVSQMVWKNDYLLDKNANILNFTQKILSGFSSDYQTKNTLLVSKPTKEDVLKGLWQDGKPIKSNPFKFNLGDGYVTSASSGDMFSKKIALGGNHGEVISKKENVVKILEELGVATASAVGSDSDSRKKMMVFKLNSPGTLEVCQASVCGTNLGLVFVDKKMIIVPGFADGNFEVKVKSFGELGNYQLQIGEINETAEWSDSYGKLTDTKQVDSYTYNTADNQTVADQATNNRNINLYFPHGIEMKNINKIRQDLLRQIDVNIGLKNTQSFDFLIEKWIALDSYVSGLDPKKIKGMNHKDWGEHNNDFVRSRFITKFPDYFTERLVEIYTDLDINSDRYHHIDNFYKLDKKVQITMLRVFLRL